MMRGNAPVTSAAPLYTVFESQSINSGAQIDSTSTSWQSIASSPTTPEPATAMLSLLALAGLAARRRH